MCMCMYVDSKEGERESDQVAKASKIMDVIMSLPRAVAGGDHARFEQENGHNTAGYMCSVKTHTMVH